jgi:hypothetical protein
MNMSLTIDLRFAQLLCEAGDEIGDDAGVHSMDKAGIGIKRRLS